MTNMTNVDMTAKRIKAEIKIKAIMANLDIHAYDAPYDYLLAEGLAMRDIGYTYKEISDTLAEKAALHEFGF